jgi:hypothetical protein
VGRQVDFVNLATRRPTTGRIIPGRTTGRHLTKVVIASREEIIEQDA